ncbi:uncharacterized protein [Ptychodera flava]|uniref:uncharacterized protein n=1 Tax=Ptychodera flava TaxID=63121 RepID=UPI003969E0C0
MYGTSESQSRAVYPYKSTCQDTFYQGDGGDDQREHSVMKYATGNSSVMTDSYMPSADDMTENTTFPSCAYSERESTAPYLYRETNSYTPTTADDFDGGLYFEQQNFVCGAGSSDTVEKRHPRRRRSFSTNPYVVQRHAANIRERKRMMNINSGFEELRCHVPTFPYEKRLSKIDTLRLAIAYIALLREVLLSGCPPMVYVERCMKTGFKDGKSPVWNTSDLTARLSWIKWD